VRYTEFIVFRHMDPSKGHPAPTALAGELIRFSRALYPIFLRVAEKPPRDAEWPPLPRMHQVVDCLPMPSILNAPSRGI
jgi:hypothetical protein